MLADRLRKRIHNLSVETPNTKKPYIPRMVAKPEAVYSQATIQVIRRGSSTKFNKNSSLKTIVAQEPLVKTNSITDLSQHSIDGGYCFPKNQS